MGIATLELLERFRLEVVYPPWRTKVECIESGPLIPVDRRIDDGTNPTRVYDAVYVCRSGAWVPPWCDDQFQQFLEGYPWEWSGQEMPDNSWNQPRPDVVPQARVHMEAKRRMNDLLDEHLGLGPQEGEK